MSAFLDFTARCHAEIATRIRKTLTDVRQQGADYGGWTDDVLERLERYAFSGKMLRGALAILAYRGYGGNRGEGEPAGRDSGAQGDGEKDGGEPASRDSGAQGDDARILHIAAGLELLQSFLLIHDDIIDQDMLRRGQKSVHAQYAAHLDEIMRGGDSLHYGISMAICCGDIAFATANMCIERALYGAAAKNAAGATVGNTTAHSVPPLPPHTQLRIKELYNREIIRVGIAQMDDIAFSYADREPTTQEVLRLYRNKTGYYSIVLPLQLGALAAQQYHELPALQKIGLLLGEVFQIRDDLLGLEQDAVASPTPRDAVASPALRRDAVASPTPRDAIASPTQQRTQSTERQSETQPAAQRKSIASDIANGKKTYIRQLLIAGNNPRHLQRLRELESAALPEAQLLARYRALLQHAGIIQQTNAHLTRSTESALALIDDLQECRAEEKELLRQFCIYNSQRRA